MGKQKNLAESLNNIINIIEGCCTDAGGQIHVDPEFLHPFDEETAYLKERLGLEPFQSILFAVIIQADANRRCNVCQVASRLGMSYLQLLSYSNELFALRNRELIRIRGNTDISVPAEVIDCIMKDKVFLKPRIDGLTTKSLLNRVFAYVKRVYDQEYTFWQALEEIDNLLVANPDTSYAATLEKHKIGALCSRVSPPERMLFHILAFLYLRKDYTVFDMGDVEDFFRDDEAVNGLRDLFDSESLGLQILDVIEPAKGDGFLERNSFCINEDFVKEVFADINLHHSNIRTVDLSDLAAKPAKQLFYNNEERAQIERLEALLEKDSLNRVFEGMKGRGLRTGLICLFYGDPGTGKTETVYQMARRTGRKILEADVAKLRNCYVGETEKNMRALFMDYRTACEENELMPILLFNEADAILGTRMEGAVKSVDRMENSVQNILLQEMENFEGIMVATTNLMGNLDPAFERRFLFKIRFNKPDQEPRSRIWKSQFPALTDEQAASIAGEFQLSGGQIENVVRKYTIDSILSGNDGGYQRLRQYCREETMSRPSCKRIGF